MISDDKGDLILDRIKGFGAGTQFLRRQARRVSPEKVPSKLKTPSGFQPFSLLFHGCVAVLRSVETRLLTLNCLLLK